MLKKLLKYDFRANMKIFLFVWPAILVFAVLERFVIRMDLGERLNMVLVNLITTLYVLAVIAACAFALVISIVRFYSGLLRDEGYLMFTLPVRPWQLLLSKFITALVTISVTIGLSILSVGILLDKPYRIFIAFGFDSNVVNTVGYILLYLIPLLALSAEILKIYLACAVGHLARRKRILFAVLFYYGLNVVLEVAAVTLLTSLDSCGIFSGIAKWEVMLHPESATALLLGAIDVLLLIFNFAYFFITERILRKRLNLE